MKIIDILNKIAKGEDIPSQIYHNNLYYDFEDGDYFNQKTRNWLFNDSDIETILNDEVKTKEEDKKIEKLDDNISYRLKTKDILWNDNELIMVNKINEIIDYLNNKE